MFSFSFVFLFLFLFFLLGLFLPSSSHPVMHCMVRILSASVLPCIYLTVFFFFFFF
ncbi:hypothetical protein FN846DRAFT_949946 [Sphaerosporella brunnea]|uniref:Uncharacterized protein n=1 Tax=Sphaerosporella brunnea TaxID=1250544 RepID=A0A5J5EWJ3_9PEZI|nr:hypothetical protein FN846DRAFT_949946 [Sphaerosporella brunnea]